MGKNHKALAILAILTSMNAMAKYFSCSLFVFCMLWICTAESFADSQQENADIVLLEVSGAIGPVSSDYIIKGIKHAEDTQRELLIIQLDTPGGLDVAMRTINKAILASSVPVAIYVSPAGARATSAGTYMLYASHVAAMAPGTHMGASTPVQMGGIPGGSPDKPTSQDKSPKKQSDSDNAAEQDKELTGASNREKTVMETKMVNDATAYLRGLANLRGRNAEWAEQTVREAKSLTAEEALAQNVIDVVASDLTMLLEKIHGRSVKTIAGERILNTQGAAVERILPDWRMKLLSVLTDPNIAYFLLLLGFYGLIYEFMNPGFVLPGVVGAICLVLALYALQVLPINYAGLALILLGIAFMVVEAFIPSFGVMGIGGLVAFAVGSVILLDEEGYSISIPLIAGNVAVSGVFFIWVLGRVLKLRRQPPVSGIDIMVGEFAQVAEDFAERGWVRIEGELWSAIADVPVVAGQQVRIKGVEGLLLYVEALESYSENKGITT